MIRIALKMLMSDRAKYLSLVLGLSFAVLLITQQCSIFLGLLLRGTGFVQNVGEPDLWVADRHTTWVTALRPMNREKLIHVRSTPGVAWAEPLFASQARVDLPDGSYRTGQLLGIDRTTLVARPPQMIAGSVADLRIPDAIVLEESSAEKLGVGVGDVIKLNDRRAVVVGLARARLSFESNALIYTTFERAINFVPTSRERLSLILVELKPGADIAAVQLRIARIPELRAFTRDEFQWRTIQYILGQTGIGINFGVTVTLGFIVGLVVSAAIFHQFATENLRQFAVLKAMGATRWKLVGMILTQAGLVGLVSYGIGVGAAGAFSYLGRDPGSELSVYFPWQLLVVSLVATLLCVCCGSVLSLRRVLALDPAIVFT